MADPRGFLKAGREGAERRPVEERVNDWQEAYAGAGFSNAIEVPLPIDSRTTNVGTGVEWANQSAMVRVHITGAVTVYTGTPNPPTNSNLTDVTAQGIPVQALLADTFESLNHQFYGNWRVDVVSTLPAPAVAASLSVSSITRTVASMPSMAFRAIRASRKAGRIHKARRFMADS